MPDSMSLNARRREVKLIGVEPYPKMRRAKVCQQASSDTARDFLAHRGIMDARRTCTESPRFPDPNGPFVQHVLISRSLPA
jgi:hypothetical protein